MSACDKRVRLAPRVLRSLRERRATCMLLLPQERKEGFRSVNWCRVEVLLDLKASDASVPVEADELVFLSAHAVGEVDGRAVR